ncbi:hypothetical protein BGZ52_012387 [Haplosporangium bisporale]|nr:hypothetical protein BGZ52_012387 [Haplosporangium bisporale]
MNGSSCRSLLSHNSIKQGRQLAQVRLARTNQCHPTFSKALSTSSGSTSKSEEEEKQNQSVAPPSDVSEASNTTTPEPKEDLYKKFNLKPSAEVGIRVGLREKKEQQERDLEAQKAVAEATETEAAKINRLFAKLQAPDHISSTSTSVPSSSVDRVDGAPKKKSNDAWKFLFDEDDLDKRETDSKEMLDRIPGASDHFPSVSEHRSLPPSSASTSSTSTTFASSDRWKDPKQKAVEKDAFKALFASLFEHNRPNKDDDPSGPTRVQSLFSNFNRSGLPESSTSSSSSSDSLFSPLPFTHPSSSSPSSSETPESTPTESPMAILRRQLKSLSERSEPIYLEKKPKTSSFQVMESTVGPQDWMNRETALPAESNLFTAIREENKVAIRMRKELEEKQQDMTKVKDFVDELIAPFLPSSTESGSVKPSGVGLDSLLAQAIMYASSTKASISEVSPTNGNRSLHPWMGHAMVEHARRQGLPVFIRTVRTESYKALLQSRWNAWQDGPGCLEILKEMQRSGALVDAETRSLVRGMIRDLKATSVDGSGWGYDEQVGPLKEMLEIIKSAEEDRDQDLDARPSSLAGSALGKPMFILGDGESSMEEKPFKRMPQGRTDPRFAAFQHKDRDYSRRPFRENRH